MLSKTCTLVDLYVTNMQYFEMVYLRIVVFAKPLPCLQELTMHGDGKDASRVFMHTAAYSAYVVCIVLAINFILPFKLLITTI
jgi:hypothetical protein